jgi:hypothetical protein
MIGSVSHPMLVEEILSKVNTPSLVNVCIVQHQVPSPFLRFIPCYLE